jgi:integrase
MKQLTKTKTTVRLRKVEGMNEWYLYIESYPVMVSGKDKPQRVREYLNRTVRTVDWDKKRRARTDNKGLSTYKPKRDDNGIIICKSDADKETILYADGIRKLRQREYDNESLYSDIELSMVQQKDRSNENFINYFSGVNKKRHVNSSDSIKINWERTIAYFKDFAGDHVTFKDVDVKIAEDFKTFLLSSPKSDEKKNGISRNTASTYFSIFKALLKQAFIDNYITIDLSAKIKGISEQQSKREYLTICELNKLVKTPCKNNVIKRAALFSALTGLRHCDIQKLRWEEISFDDQQIRVNFTQKKTKAVEYMPISKQAFELCGKPDNLQSLVFEGLPDPSWISRPLKKWIESAGISKHITFHCFRHTFATLQLTKGTDIYTVSKMLGHTDIKTTQIYAKVVDEKKNTAASAIVLEEQ